MWTLEQNIMKPSVFYDITKETDRVYNLFEIGTIMNIQKVDIETQLSVNIW